jgi:hypothetical protein
LVKNFSPSGSRDYVTAVQNLKEHTRAKLLGYLTNNEIEIEID